MDDERARPGRLLFALCQGEGTSTARRNRLFARRMACGRDGRVQSHAVPQDGVGRADGDPSDRGVIFDFFQMMAPKHLGATVLDPEKTPEFGDLFGGLGPEQYERWEECRAQTARLAGVPFMHNPSLLHLLGVAAGLPTLLLWGREDGIVPVSAGEGYRRAIAGAKLIVFEGCGHRPEIEKTADFIRETEAFLA